MNKFNLISILIGILINSYFINCLDESSDINRKTTIQISADQAAYNIGQQIKVNIKITGVTDNYNLLLSCKDEEKCEKIFKCSSKCNTIELKKGINFETTVELKALSSGKVILYLTNSTENALLYPDLSKSFIQIPIGQSQILDYISMICGWIYFVSWSVSFYPQIFLNIRRKSVVGLNFDFIALNVTGFFFYSIFNVAMYYVKSVQDEYVKHHQFSLIPVEFNDVVFAVHAFIVSVFTLIQCYCIYERQNQSISKPSIGLLIIFWLIAIISTIVLSFGSLNVLSYLNLLSYIKLFISFIKYIPQAYYNYQRKSTVGWSIGNILLDFIGGSFSLLQICILNFNYDDWGNIKGNLTKFGLGLLSMSFDVLFMIQHYILYRNHEDKDRMQSSSDDDDSENRRITRS